ncbi:MAG: LysR family transcriptional regulator [Myxococcales bacterium]|nr:LysR family transcriptional regulator [Myxococcales bacterium]
MPDSPRTRVRHDHGSFTVVGERLALTPSAVSQAVARVEALLGMPMRTWDAGGAIPGGYRGRGDRGPPARRSARPAVLCRPDPPHWRIRTSACMMRSCCGGAPS